MAATGSPLNNPGGAVPGALGDGLVAEWNAATGMLLARPVLLCGAGGAVDVAFAARGTTVAVTQLSNKVAIVDPGRGKVLARWDGSATAEYMLGAALSPDGRRVATADLEGWLRVLDAASGKLVLPQIRASANLRRLRRLEQRRVAARHRGIRRNGAPLQREHRSADRHAASGAGS